MSSQDPTDERPEYAVASVGPISHAIFRVARLHKMLAGKLLREAGLYPGQELLMMQLWDHGPQRQVDLVRALESDAPTVTRSIRRLEKSGFVVTGPSETDGRVTMVRATGASMPLRRSVERIWAELEALTVEPFSNAERSDARSALEGIERNLLAAQSRLMD